MKTKTPKTEEQLRVIEKSKRLKLMIAILKSSFYYRHKYVDFKIDYDAIMIYSLENNITFNSTELIIQMSIFNTYIKYDNVENRIYLRVF